MGFFKEFKEFISKGSVVDMAIGIIVGSAFTSIVTSLVDDIFMPLIGNITGGLNFTDWKIGNIAYGNFISAVVNFLIVAFVLFSIIKALNKARDLAVKTKAEEAPTEKECPYCKSMIPIAATRCPHCTSQLD